MVGLVPVVAAVVLALAVPWQLDGLLDPPQVAVPASLSRRAAAAELHELVPPMGRHLLAIPPTMAIGTDNPSRWLTVASGPDGAPTSTSGGPPARTPPGSWPSTLLWTIDPADALDTLRGAGVTHVVTADPAHAAALDQRDGFARVWWQDDVAIHRVLAAPAARRPATCCIRPARNPWRSA